MNDGKGVPAFRQPERQPAGVVHVPPSAPLRQCSTNQVRSSTLQAESEAAESIDCVSLLLCSVLLRRPADPVCRRRGLHPLHGLFQSGLFGRRRSRSQHLSRL